MKKTIIEANFYIMQNTGKLIDDEKRNHELLKNNNQSSPYAG